MPHPQVSSRALHSPAETSPERHTFFRTLTKQLDLLKEAIPGLTDVAILLNPPNPMIQPYVAAMRRPRSR